MSDTLHSKLTATGIALTSCLLSVGAASAFNLNGAWSTNPDECAKVFERRADGIALSASSDVYGSGFVIDGKKIVGKTARCTITSTKEDGSTINFLASCATEIMFDNIQFSLKIVNDDAISRIFPGIPEMSVTYSRCPASSLRRST
jgi:hypothetical protein